MCGVTIGLCDGGGFGLAVKLEVVAGEIPQAKLETPARVAHEKICPCSHRTRGNIEADLTVVTPHDYGDLNGHKGQRKE